MKNDFKVFIFFILLVIVYGFMHYLDGVGKFVFSPMYSNFVLGIISLGYFFNKKFTKYSFLLISLGFSFLYVFSSMEGFSLIHKSNFILIKNVSLIAFSLFVLNDIAFNKIKSMKVLFLSLAILILGYFASKIILEGKDFTPYYTLIKNGIGFILIGLMLRINREKNTLSIITKRVIMVIALSFFVEILGYFVGK